MIRNDEDDSSGVRPPHAAPSLQKLRERIQQNRELARISASARRRVGAPTPSNTEVKAVFTAREAAAARHREESLQGDRHRRGVVSIQYYDISMTATTTDTFQEAQPLSDVEARRTVLRPLKKLVAILAARQRFASLLRTASGGGTAVHIDQASAQIALQSAFPASSPLPNISTLLRGITLPDVAEVRRLAEPDHTGQTYGFVEMPRLHPLHEPFEFRLKRFMPVLMPEFVLDVASHADKEVRQGDGEYSSELEANNIPRLMAVHPSAVAKNLSRFTSFPTSMQPAKEATLGRSPADAAPVT